MTASPPQNQEDGGSWVMRFGAVVGLAVAAATASTVPASVRVAHALPGGVAVEHAWAGLATLALAPMLASILLLRAAREGLRAFGGSGASLRVYGVVLWLAWLVIGLSVFGSALRRSTHQHALAGVTFAFGAAAAAVTLGVAGARVMDILKGSDRHARLVGVLLGAGTVSALAWLGYAFMRAIAGDPASKPAAWVVLDLLAFLLAAFLASRRSIAAQAVRRSLALVGPPVAVVLVAVGLSSLKDAALVDAMVARAPAFARAFDLVRSP